MKHKFSSMGRVVIALVLALSLTLVMAAPVAAFVTSATVTIDPTTKGRPAEYTIEFTTTADLYATDNDTITITFHADTTVSQGTAAYNSYVTVNDDVCVDEEVTGASQVVTIIVDKDVPAGVVTVVIAAGITNPDTVATDWTLNVQTNKEPSDVESQTYSTTAITAPYIVSVVGTAYQNSNDTIVITFSEDVMAVAEPFDASNELAIKCGGSVVDLTTADFSPDSALTETLTITLVEAEASLEIGTDNLEVTPVSSQIENKWEDAFVAVTPVSGDVVGDTVAPTVALTYSDDDQLVKENDNLVITATFSEAMQDTPTIAIDTQGTDLEAVAFTGGSGAIWTYTYVVTAGSDGVATVTVVGKDLAGTANQVATNNTFVIDNTAPFVAVTGITGSTTGTDTIEITFSEDVVASDDTWDANEVTSITMEKADEADVTVNLGGAEYAYEAMVLTITLAEAGADTTNKDYLLNGYTLTVDPHDSNTIADLAGNLLDTEAVEGTTPVTGDLDVPTITGIVGVGADTIQIAFSELVVAFDDSWSANEFSIESPDGAPLNINNATFNVDDETVATTVLTIVLDTPDDAAVLVEGEAILATPTADAVVDLAGNPLAADEISSGADSGWLEIWVDDSWTGQTGETGVDEFDPSLIWGANAFDDIEAGYIAVGSGGTLKVRPGNYVLTDTLTIDKNGVILQSTGDAEDTFIDAGSVTTPLVFINADAVTVEGFTIGDVPTSQHGIKIFGADAIVKDNIITATGAVQIGIYIHAVGSMVTDNELKPECTMMLNEVSECTLSGNTFGESLNLYPNPGDTGIDGLTITGNTMIGSTAQAIDFEAGKTFRNILIEGNTISATDKDAGAIEIRAVAEVTNLRILGNDITDNQGPGISIAVNAGWAADAGNVINNNNISNNDKGAGGDEDVVGIENNMTTGVEVDATLNWWGTAFATDVAEMFTGAGVVAYSPWLDALAPYGEPTTTGGLDIQWGIDLAAGWNLISLPLICIDSSIDTVLAGADVTINKVAYYTGGPAGTWDYYNPPPVPSDLTTMDDGKGYWIDASAEGTLTVAGVELAQPGLPPPSYGLVEGWNLIGSTSIYPTKKVQIYLGPAVMATVEAMYKYEADTGLYAAIVEGDDLTPGDGYWLAVNAEGRIYP